ncbi:DUF342 domain-containing protein [Bacillus testis]|uniref:DUF342 domain-containing protein n=1 Tax=Bacillus testis TaxID=1622072 RepID=UPI000AE391B8|nr:FapA family protein [Bacillus testis]
MESLEVLFSQNGLEASIVLGEGGQVPEVLTADQVNECLKKNGVCYGIQPDVIEMISQNPQSILQPVIVAKGNAPVNGMDGYLVNKVTEDQIDSRNDEDKVLNLRNVMTIPSVKNGQLLAEIVPPSLGVPGMDVKGKILSAKDGRPLKWKAGKNVLFHLNNVYATLDGQVSITSNTVNVFPIFEVDSDLDLKTGNIDFIGNVVIRGDVPAGYQIQAGGDIKVSGLVEGSHLKAGGSIYIEGGIAGGNRGITEAGSYIYASYLNQAHCKAGDSVYVDSSILHSKIECGGSVICKKGHVIGGEISALKSVEALDFGNHHYMHTHIFAGDSQRYMEQEATLQKKIAVLNESLVKLASLSEKMKNKNQFAVSISNQDRMMMEKQKVTVRSYTKQLEELEEELVSLQELKIAHEESFVKSQGTMYPNTELHFGKYSKKIHANTSRVKMVLSQGEIVSVPL